VPLEQNYKLLNNLQANNKIQSTNKKNSN